MNLLLLLLGVPIGGATLLVWTFFRALRSDAAEARAVTVAAPLALSAGLAYAVRFPALVRELRSSTAALNYLGLPLLASVVAGVAFAVVWAGSYLALARLRQPSRAAGAAALLALGGAALLGVAHVARLGAAARAPGATPADLRRVHASFRRFERANRIAAAFLLANGSNGVLARVAEHPRCPEDVWRDLARDPDPTVSWRALRNAAIPPDALRALAEGATPAIRAGLAANPATPPELLRAFARAGDVDASLWSNAALPDDVAGPVLVRTAATKDPYLRAAVAGSPRAPAELLAALAEDREALVRRGAAGNRATPPEALARLADDADAGVRTLARANPARPGGRR